MCDNETAQNEEVEALQAIYDDLAYDPVKKRGELEIRVELDESIEVESVKLEHLPPIQFVFKMTDEYPSQKPPLIHITSSWLSKRQLTVAGSNLTRLTFFIPLFDPDLRAGKQFGL